MRKMCEEEDRHGDLEKAFFKGRLRFVIGGKKKAPFILILNSSAPSRSFTYLEPF